MRLSGMFDARHWAEAQFGNASLGDARRTSRLVKLAAEVAFQPAGLVTRACASTASREGAFRLLENPAVHPAAIREAVTTGTVRACRALRSVIVPLDGTSLRLTEGIRARGLGAVGSWAKGARGVQVMTALALTPSGAPIGLCAQTMWMRTKRSPFGQRGACGKPSENRVWLEQLGDMQSAFAEHAPDCRPWFQMDRGADCREVLGAAVAHDLQITVRAAHDRATDDDTRHLWAILEQAPVVISRQIQLVARPPSSKNKRTQGFRARVFSAPRKPRLATVALRAATVPIKCTSEKGRKYILPLNVVFVRESNRPPEDRVEWMLLTTHPIATPHDVLEVARAYALRWRIEDFHRLWKRGLCRVEDTQLQSRDAICKWATILAAVATRAMHLTHLARETPDVPASTELSTYELAAVFALRRPKGVDPNTIPSLGLAVRWIGEIGGHSGPWRGPPGATTVGRGLHDITIAARVFEFTDQKR